MGQAATATITCPEAAQAMAQKHVEDVNMSKKLKWKKLRPECSPASPACAEYQPPCRRGLAGFHLAL
jgi:hypothetical protein